jgi:hypothetical protein
MRAHAGQEEINTAPESARRYLLARELERQLGHYPQYAEQVERALDYTNESYTVARVTNASGFTNLAVGDYVLAETRARWEPYGFGETFWWVGVWSPRAGSHLAVDAPNLEMFSRVTA